jgi:ubiquitin carboxyl-terminal hydrolase 5/13
MPEQLDLECLRSTGLQPGETQQPEDEEAPLSSSRGGGGGSGGAAAAPAAAAEADATIVAQLISMGFSENGSKRAGVLVFWLVC